MTDPFAAGKPENKLLLFWRLGMPVVASATPAYKRAMLLADVDMYCSTSDEWVTTIIACIENQAYRKEMALRGNAVALRNYSEENTLLAWDQVFASIST
jgi:glycosyltransferase involved in cell wall biosynthesis